MLPNLCEIEPNKISTNLKSKVFWIHGEPGTWKTTVASKFPRALIAGFEIGYQFINGVYAIPMQTWSDMKDLYRQLKNSKVKEKYDTIVFDTISSAATLCYKYALNSLEITDPAQAAYGKGWRVIKDEWKVIDDICKLGYCIVFISHSKETEVTDKKTNQTYTKVKTDLDGWSSTLLWSLSDFVFYVRKEIDDEDGVEKVYAYSDLPNIDTKRRHPSFPQRFYFSYENIIDGLNKIIEHEASLGHEINSTQDNIREFAEEPWENIRDEVIALVRELADTSAQPELERYIPELFGDVRLSQTTNLHRDKLIAARDYLKQLKDSLGQ